jgi:LPXTG-motif cell wall-anchored protein
MRRLLLVVMSALCLIVTAGSHAAAQVADITIPIDTVIRQQPIGSTHQLASVPVPTQLVGTTCTAMVVGENNDSVHPGNNLIVASGTDSVIAYDVERAPLASTPADGTLTLADTIVVSVVLGDGDPSPNLQTFSGGVVVHFDCTPTTTTTTSTTTTIPTTTTVPPTTTPPTTTPPTEPPTTVPPTTAPQTTPPPTVEQSGGDPSTTTTAAQQLPATGPTATGALLAAAAIALLSGTVILLALRRPASS